MDAPVDYLDVGLSEGPFQIEFLILLQGVDEFRLLGLDPRHAALLAATVGVDGEGNDYQDCQNEGGVVEYLEPH